ncbi:V-type ATPase subunit [Anaerotalea alkaliphila]|uniref:V-type ATPase subunit n=1 Tax=Anaerotalea alkaliphila TaxID=2662126 RepID=A0A7X5HTU3_9FIRM|nr:V-type ATPase subunit [Anaerotalea alkaliphila]NDL66534.1 V-type ATPase subunit [Anaerotalea alkaliphila]
MLDMFRYSHLSTKVRAMRGKMLTREDFQQLLQKRNVRDVALYLKHNTYYADALATVNEDDVHRGYLEILFYRSLIGDALKIARYLKGGEQAVYRMVYRKQEIEDLKKMLRILATGNNLTEIDRKILFISKYSKIDFNKTLKANDVRELVDSLHGTRFYPILNPLVREDGGIDLFAAEMALDGYYYDRTFEQVRSYPNGSGREMIEEMLGQEVDFKNVLMIYRGKRYYKVGREVLQLYLIPYHYALKKEDFDKMIDADSAEEVVRIVSRKHRMMKIVDFTESEWERQYNQKTTKDMSRRMRETPFSFAPVLAYLFLKEMEIVNITTVVEGIRYQVDPKEIKSMLIGNFGGEA